MKINTWLPVATFFFLAACTSQQKTIEHGNYDQAIRTHVQKLTGKKDKSPVRVLELETAFRKATERDMRAVKGLKQHDRPENWTRIHDIYRDIEKRQRLIEPLLPLVDRKGYQANFSFVKVAMLQKESREKAADYLYQDAISLLQLAKDGDKAAAREAFHQLQRIEQYFVQYREKDQLLQEAKALGTVHIVFDIKNEANVLMNAAFEQELVSINVRKLNTEWRKYYSTSATTEQMDYQVTLHLTHLEVSPEKITEREYVDHKEIEDGWTYVLDDNGNVMKDTLGNDIKVPRMAFIKAVVFETYQYKDALVRGVLAYTNLRTGQRIAQEPLEALATFENFAATYQGDRRALSSESCSRIGNVPLPFPSNEALLLRAVRSLKPMVANKIRRTQVFNPMPNSTVLHQRH